MKLTRQEAKILAALVEGPKMTGELCEIARCGPEGIRRHVANIRAKLPAGGVRRVAQYGLTGDAPKAVARALERMPA